MLTNGRTIVWIMVIVSILFIFCVGSLSSGQAEKRQSMPPQATISASLVHDDIEVIVVLTNNGTTPFPLLQWNLPADGHLTSNLFEVYRNGKHQQYDGEMVKRRATPDDYILLQPHKEYKARISLKQGYDVRSSGEYKITYRAWNQVPSGSLTVVTSDEIIITKK